MSQLISFNPAENDALVNLFRYYLYRRKVGITVCLTGGQGQKTGAGKSYTAMRLAQRIDHRFSIDDVCFTPAQFLQRLDAIESAGQIGRCVVLDEGEIAISSRKWQQLNNETIGETMQTFRYLRCMAIIVTPLFSYIDKNVRKLISYWGTTSIETHSSGLRCKLRLYNLLTDIMGEKLYPRRLTFWDKTNRRITRAREFDVGLMSPELMAQYEDASREFKNKHRQKLLKQTLALDRISELEENITRSELPQAAADMLENQSVLRILSERGRISAASILLMKKNLPSNNANLLSQMINELAQTRGIVKAPEPQAPQAVAKEKEKKKAMPPIIADVI